ncbi:MAG: tetratricopeptide repeat protein [Thermoguttaceae bacterium]
MNERRTSVINELLLAAALTLAVVAAYWPALHGGFLWDDDGHVTRPGLRSWEGLYRIWYEPGATQQYYPVLHTAFWIEHRLWGNAVLGYHLINVLLHATAALLVALVLRRLKVPGAMLAAAIFALHPVHVESVAWITEQKNTLSAVFYLAAMFVYLRFDETRKPLLYCVALGLFVLGLESKTVTATLPAAMLVIFWWQRGRLSWRRDVLPLMPLFALGAVAGVITAIFERKLIGAEGEAFSLSFIESLLMGSRALWFYLGKLLWPANLIFIYPRWQLDPSDWRQYVPLAAALGLFAAALAARHRGPLAALLFFAGTLFPVLGFCNVYPFIYSFVADHFQYLASLGVITLFAAAATGLWQRLDASWRDRQAARRQPTGKRRRPAGTPVAVAPMPAIGVSLSLALLAALATLTWRQAGTYADLMTLYETTIERNPECWMAEDNLGVLLAENRRFEEAIPHHLRALQIKPNHVKALNNLGFAAAALGRADEAIAYYGKALKFKPDDAQAHYNLANLLTRLERLDGAIEHYRAAIKAEPRYLDAYCNLAAALAAKGRIGEAIAYCRQALAIRPASARAWMILAELCAASHQQADALAAARQALALATEQGDGALADAARARIRSWQAASGQLGP